jgi:hypothetical protein
MGKRNGMTIGVVQNNSKVASKGFNKQHQVPPQCPVEVISA